MRRILVRETAGLVFVLAAAALQAAACGTSEETSTGDGGGSTPDASSHADATVDSGSDVGVGQFGGFDATTDQGSSSGGSGSGSGGTEGGQASGGNPCVPPTQLAITPSSPSVTVQAGAPFTQTFTVTATYANSTTADVTAQSFFTLGNASAGTMSGATFTWGGTTGGIIPVQAKTCGVTASTNLTLKLAGVFGAGGGGGSDGGAGSGDGGASIDAGAAASAFATAGTTTNAACNPSLVYPADGVLLPPNTNVIEVHFLPGNNTQFEISFESAASDVRIYTTCTGATPDLGMPMGGGCVFELNQAEWDYVARSNADGDPVTVKVRGLGCDGTNAGSSSTRSISFAKDDLVGTLYYWASMRIGASVFSGGVFRYDFGVRDQTASPVLTPTYGGNGLCIGCHDISRDGRKMLFDYDDNDADDEYTDVNTDIFDVAARTFATTGALSKGRAFEPGFHTWNRAHSRFLLSDGAHVTTAGGPNGSFTVRADDAGLVGYTPTPPAAIRGTTPDLAPDDSTVVFAAAPNQAGGSLGDAGAEAGYWAPGNAAQQDEWFSGASLYVAPWDASHDQIGPVTPLLASNGTDNYYYPSYSPDGSLIVFNHAVDGPNFHNPKARVQVVPAGASNPTPDDLAALNADPTNGGLVTNSWARWAPFVQSYKGGQILWLTMSSTRDYGLRIQNDGLQNCYPTESPKGAPYSTRTFTSTSLSPACTRTQLWMAAVKLDANGVAAGNDVSFPAFWLPFQDMTTNNHLGQWAQRSYTGTCNAAAADAGAAPDAGGCAPGLCCDNGACAPCLAPPPPPPAPPAECVADPNCAPGTCCNSGTCGACPDSGTGTGDAAGGGTGDAASGTGGSGCNTCLNCNGQACIGGQCAACTNSTQCCAPLMCVGGQCQQVIQ
jgi:hypothetical protein